MLLFSKVLTKSFLFKFEKSFHFINVSATGCHLTYKVMEPDILKKISTWGFWIKRATHDSEIKFFKFREKLQYKGIKLI